ncbi:MAG TPA: hypothetical protein VF092_18010 [Longimicrobium sp.]
MTLLVNQILMCTESERDPVRVLWLEPAHLAARRVAVIRLARDERIPEWEDLEALTAAVDNGVYVIASVDTFAPRASLEEDLTEVERRVRDARYGIIRPLVEDPEQSILYEDLRGPLIKSAAEQSHTSRKNVYHLLGLYWRGGQTPNALVPAYVNSGRSGSRITAGADTTTKRGRPRKPVPGKEHIVGINVNERTRKLLLLGAKEFHEKGGMPPKEAYDATIKTYFACGYEVAADGTLEPIIPAEDDRPSFGQFCYHYGAERDSRRALITRKGHKRFLLENRPVLGTSYHLGPAPGALYQIDSTRADISLRSSLRASRKIGRPIIYVVRDLFSRMIVGFHIALEGPNWLGVRSALQSAFMDKVAFCARFGRVIAAEDWPCLNVLCDEILGDRGPAEILSKNADFLINSFRVRVSNAAPSRPDWKAVIERVFPLYHHAYSWEPGAVHGPRERGEPDHRLDAVHTLSSFTRLFLELTLQFNNCTWLGAYDPDADVLRDEVPLIPRELWNWGIHNRQGALRPVSDPEALRRALMRTVEARITREGIYVPDLGLHYTSPTAEAEDWFVLERGRKRIKLELGMEDLDVSEAYLRLDRGRTVERCELLPRYAPFRGRSRDEVRDERAWERVLARDAERELAQQRVGHLHRRDVIREEQLAEVAADLAETGDKPRIATRAEMALERKHARAEQATTAGSSTAKHRVPTEAADDESIVPAASELDLLRSVGEDE